MNSNPPTFDQGSFDCPHCQAFAHQFWRVPKWQMAEQGNNWAERDYLRISECQHCSKLGVWVNTMLSYPDGTPAPPPNPDLPDEPLRTYKEAASIVSRSPRAAAALLRLAIEQLCVHQGGREGNLNGCIGDLVGDEGLRQSIQQALDAVRVSGNDAIHPGQIGAEDELPIAMSLFELANIIVDDLITEPKRIQKAYERLSDGQREQIERRDSDE